MDVQHIPAWKRLGLKLKYANEVATSLNQDSISDQDVSRKRRVKATDAANGSRGGSHQLKKARLEHEPSPNKLKINENTEHSTPRRDSPPRRKKSVSFAPDTKVEDGDSAQTIQFWVPDSPGSTPMKPSTNSSNESVPEKIPKKVRREKKPKSSKESSSSVPPRKASSAVAYLDQFYRERSSWKFNKNHETWLLKHALSTEQISPAHNLALAFYLRGLKSTAARQRLAEQSREALGSSKADITSHAERSARLLELLDEDHESNDDVSTESSWIEEMPRGQLILLSLNEKLSMPSKSGITNGSAAPKAKKNKSRTSRVEIESSSDSESESESEDEGHGNESKLHESKTAGSKESGEETSSSGYSSTSSDTDSESEEESDSSSGSE